MASRRTAAKIPSRRKTAPQRPQESLDAQPGTDDADTSDTPETDETGETGETGETEGATPEEIDASAPAEPDAAAPPPETRTVVEKTGPGFVPLVIGGVVAAGIGYFASVSGMLPGAGGTDNTAEIEAALARQSEVLAGLQDQVSTLATPTGRRRRPVPAHRRDLRPRRPDRRDRRRDRCARRARDDAGGAPGLHRRCHRGQCRGRRSRRRDGRTDARAGGGGRTRSPPEAEAAQRAAEEAIAAAEAEAAAAMAQAEAEAEAATAQAEAEAALNELRLAIAQGEPFAEPLAAVAAVTDVPEALSAAADTGVPSLEDIQDAFPAAARAALPVALRETAGRWCRRPVDRLRAGPDRRSGRRTARGR
jgi:hypothetical protein